MLTTGPTPPNQLALAAPAIDDSYVQPSGTVSEGWGSAQNEPYDPPVEMATGEEPESAMSVEGEDNGVGSIRHLLHAPPYKMAALPRRQAKILCRPCSNKFSPGPPKW